MKCSSLLALLSFCAVALLAADSPIRNLDFSQKGTDGSFTYWMQRSKNAKYEAENGTLTITPVVADGSKILMQSPIEFQPGGKYRFTFESRGEADMKGNIYIEYRNAENKLVGINSCLPAVKSTWSAQTLNFTMPEKFSGAYMVIMIGAGTGVCQFRNLKLEYLGAMDFAAMARAKAALTCFPTSVDASKWRKLGAPSGSAEFDKNVLKLTVEKGTLFFLKQVNLKPGVQYEISTTIRLEKGKYGLYVEYTNAAGKRCAINGALVNGKNAEAFLKTLKVTMPEGAKNIVVVLAANNAPAGVEFTNFTIKATAPPADPANISSWQGGKKKLVSDGKFNLVIANGAKAFSNFKFRKGQFYRFSFDGVTLKSADLTGFATFQLSAKLNNKAFFTSDWDDLINGRMTAKQFTFQAPDSGLGLLEISSKGEIELATMRIEEVIPADACPAVLTLTTPAYRNTIFDNQREAITGSLTLKQPAVSAEISLASEKSPKKLILQKKNQTGAFKLTESQQLPIGNYLLTITPVDAKGKALQGLTTKISIIKAPKVCFQYKPADNTFYRNGQPVSYHGFMHGYSPELAWLYQYYDVTVFAEHAGTPEQLLKALNKAQKLGFQLLLSLRVDFYYRQKKDFLRDWQRYITYMLTPEVLNHPALVGYIHADEPAWCGFPMNQLAAVTEIIHKIDPTRPVWINEAPRGSVEVNSRVAACCDTFGVDIYPIPYPNGHSGLEDKNITSVGAYTRRCREAAGPLKPIWMVLQGFAWKDLHHLPGAIYPTAAESRYMALESMVNGAHCNLYYGINSIKNAKFYLEVLQSIHEVAQLNRLWQTGNTLKIPAAPGMKIFAGTVDGQRFIVALNTTPAPLDSKLDLNGLYELPSGKPASNTMFDKYTARVFATVPKYPGNFTKPIPYDKAKESQALAALNKMFAPTTKYTGNAKWIWYPGDEMANNCESVLALDFTLKAAPVKTRLLTAADDTGFVTLNGTQLGLCGGWRIMEHREVKDLLKKGSNRIEIKVASMGAPPSGLLADLQVEYADGSKENLVTNETWQAIKLNQPMKKAQVIAPYGGGAWGDKLEFYSAPVSTH